MPDFQHHKILRQHQLYPLPLPSFLPAPSTRVATPHRNGSSIHICCIKMCSISIHATRLHATWHNMLPYAMQQFTLSLVFCLEFVAATFIPCKQRKILKVYTIHVEQRKKEVHQRVSSIDFIQ